MFGGDTKAQLTLRHPGLSWFQTFAYASPVIAISLLAGNVVIVLQGVYAKYFGLPLTTIAWVFLVSRIFDAVTDPLIGYAADRYYTKRGSRKPFIVCGGILLVFSGWFLYSPGDSVSGGYFLFWMLAFFTAMTMVDIPHMAWGGSLAKSSQEKNRIYGVRSFCFFSGILLFFCLPYLPFFESTEVTPRVLQLAVMASAIVMVPALFISVRYVPNAGMMPIHSMTKSDNWLEQAGNFVRSIFANKPLLIVTAAHICTGMGSGVWFSLLFIFADSYLGLGEHFALAFIFGLAGSLAGFPLWNIANARFGKRSCWAAAMALVSAAYLVGLLLTPENASFSLLAGIVVFVYLGLAQFNIAVPAFISDAADYAQWKFKTERSATYFSLYTFVNKSVAAIGAALGLAFVGWTGFDPAASEQGAGAIRGLYVAIGLLLTAFFLISILFILKIPLTERRNAIIRKRLDARSLRANACRTMKLAEVPPVLSSLKLSEEF